MSSCWWSAATLARSNIGADLELAGSDLVVAGLGRDAELEQLALGVEHERQHPLGDGPEVVVVELLALRAAWPRTGCGPMPADRGGRRRSSGRSGSTPARRRRTRRRRRARRGRTASAPARPGRPWPAASAGAASCGRGPRRSSRRTPWGCTGCCRWGSRGCRRGWWRPSRCSRGPRTWPAGRRSGSWTRRARPGSGSCRRTRRSTRPSASGSRKLSCFSAVRPVSG